MTAIEMPAREDLTPAVLEIFDDLKRRLGTVPNIYRMLAHSPEVLENYHSHMQFITRRDAGIEVDTRILVAILISRLTSCQYCYAWFSLFIKQYGGDPAVLTAINNDYRKSSLSNRTKAVLAYTEKITTSPLSISERERERLREVGLSEQDIVEVAALAACVNSMVRLVMALGVPFES